MLHNAVTAVEEDVAFEYAQANRAPAPEAPTTLRDMVGDSINSQLAALEQTIRQAHFPGQGA
jgi:hypothetical protein